MNAATIIAVMAVALALFFAAGHIYKEKKKGRSCIGCPYAGSCASQHCAGRSGDTGQ